MFTDYQSKPITRSAHQVSENDIIQKVGGLESTFILTNPGDEIVQFKAYEEVKVGDYIIYLNDEDIYHCNAEVFAERNII